MSNRIMCNHRVYFQDGMMSFHLAFTFHTWWKYASERLICSIYFFFFFSEKLEVEAFMQIFYFFKYCGPRTVSLRSLQILPTLVFIGPIRYPRFLLRLGLLPSHRMNDQAPSLWILLPRLSQQLSSKGGGSSLQSLESCAVQ